MTRRVSRRGLARRCRLARGKRETSRPSAAAIQSDDERFIPVECLNHVQAGCPGDRDGGGERVGEAEVGPGHAGRCGPRNRPARARVDQVVAALVGT